MFYEGNSVKISGKERWLSKLTRKWLELIWGNTGALRAQDISYDDTFSIKAAIDAIVAGTFSLPIGIYSGDLLRYNVSTAQWEVLTKGSAGTVLTAGPSSISWEQRGLPIVAAGGSVNAITATYSPAVTLVDLTICAFVAVGANTTTATFTPNGLSTHPITKQGGSALVAGDIPAALAVCILQYNLANTRWELLNPKSNFYVHPNHSGDVTSVGDGALTIAANAVTLGKLATQAHDTILANATAGTAVPTALAVSEQVLIGRITGGRVGGLSAGAVRTLLNVEDGANNYIHPFQFVVFGFDTEVSSGEGKYYFVIPDEITGYDLTRVAATVITPGESADSSLTTMEIQIRNITGTSEVLDMLDPPMTIDSGVTSTRMSATPAIIDVANNLVNTGDVLAIDIESIHDAPAKGLIIELVFN